MTLTKPKIKHLTLTIEDADGRRYTLTATPTTDVDVDISPHDWGEFAWDRQYSADLKNLTIKAEVQDIHMRREPS